MHDWRLLVQQRLAGLLLEDGEATQVVEELAGHLEESYQSLLRDGLSEEVAARCVLERVNDWQDLKRKLESSRNKETIVNKRVTQFWFPAFVTLALSMVLLAVIQIFGPNPWIDSMPNPMPAGRLRMAPVAVVYVSWLIFLPLIGALAAYLSRRAGGRTLAVFSSVVFPVFPYVAFFVIGLPLALILDDKVAHNITIPAFLVGLSAWVIFPAAALVAGGLLVQRFANRSNLDSVVHS
jgi:hypothetical protein